VAEFQSLFQWIPVLYAFFINSPNSALLVSILISVDSGLILYLYKPVLWRIMGFNPYFSGFRSYTNTR